jgi:glycosyltransferase involved in cell wall biosynthesis
VIIILTVHRFLPDSSAGTEVLTYQTAKELQKRGYDVEIITGYQADFATAKQRPFDTYEYDGLPVLRYHHNIRVISPNKNMVEFSYNNLLFAERFREVVKESKPDLVHFHHLMKITTSAIDICLNQNIPTVFTPTDFWIVCPTFQLLLPDRQICLGPDSCGVNCIRHFVSDTQPELVNAAVKVIPDRIITTISHLSAKQWWPEKKFSPSLHYLAERKDLVMRRINKLDKVLVPARFMENIFVQYGLNKDITRFIPFGLNLKPFQDMPPKRQTERLTFGFIGTLSEIKGAHILLEAIKRIPHEFEFQVKIYGRLEEEQHPAYTAKLKRLAEGDNRIEFCGTFPNEKIGEIFSGLDALVVPSIWYENTPLVIFSAHAAKVPVIGTNLGGISEVVHHEKNGLLFEKGNTAGLSELMKMIIKDRSLLDRLAKNIEPPLSISAYVDRLEEVYKEIQSKK